MIHQLCGKAEWKPGTPRNAWLLEVRQETSKRTWMSWDSPAPGGLPVARIHGQLYSRQHQGLYP